MRFWDASAIVPLLVVESGTPAAREALSEDPAIVVWWGTRAECAAAIARYERGGGMSAEHGSRAQRRLAALATRWTEILASEAVRAATERAVRTHPIHTVAAFQLAAALIACDGRPSELPFLSLDEPLRDAARREGFPVLPDPLPRPAAEREAAGRRKPRPRGRRRGG